MLKPVPMSRVLIVGPRDELEKNINNLYELKLLHIVDHQAGAEGLELGKPLPNASNASEVLVKLRSISSTLQIPPTPTKTTTSVALEEARQKIIALELNISESENDKKRLQSLLTDLSAKISAITPFAQLPLALSDYRGYLNLEVFVGRIQREITGIENVTQEYEAFTAPGIVAIFTPKEHAEALRNFLSQRGLSNLPIPEGEGYPKDILATLLSEKERWEKRLVEIENQLNSLRERYADFLTDAKTHLEIEVEKAEAPLRFAVTEHTFIVEGWVPKESFEKLKKQVDQLPGTFISELEVDEHHSEPPVLLRNAKPFRPFEMLTNLFGVPSYHEIDPTFILAIFFPILFGIMISDMGEGLAWLLFGAYILRKWAREPGGFRDLVIAIMWGGFWAFIFGTLIFGESFGIPFHAPPGVTSRAELVSWSTILGINVPLYAQLEKLHQVKDFIVLSVLAAYLHLGIGFIIGFFDEIGHSKKHALVKVAWFLTLTAIFVTIIVRASKSGLGQAIWNTMLAWFPRQGIEMANVGFGPQNQIPITAVGMLLVGVVIILAVEGIKVLEIFGLFANVMSYARLAGVGVAESALSFALNTIVLSSFIFTWMDGGSITLLIVGLAVAVVSHLLIFFLGAISASIQAVRLNYVEFFLKFYRGVGALFRPFGAK